MTVTEQYLDINLVRAMREGTSALPADLGKLRGYLRMIGALLEEKARELEPSWEQACTTAAEIATLQDLEVVGRGADDRGARGEHRARCAPSWRSGGRSRAGGEDGDLRSPRSRLVLSVEADLERLSSRPR